MTPYQTSQSSAVTPQTQWVFPDGQDGEGANEEQPVRYRSQTAFLFSSNS